MPSMTGAAASVLLGVVACQNTSSLYNTSPFLGVPPTLIADDSFNFELRFPLGFVQYGGASNGDVLQAAQVIQPGNFTSYNTTFYELAQNAMNVADSHVTSDPHTARDFYNYASTYYRNSDFYLHGNWSDPLIDAYWAAQTDAFNSAMNLSNYRWERLTIPADGFNVTAMFVSNDKDTVCKRPTLVVGNGYDAAQEDAFFQVGVAALARGWNLMTYDGPGQPTVRRYQGLGFIPDWENVVTPVVNYLAQRSDVDMDRLTLMGISFGGYLAARAAAFEPRIKALILDGGIYTVFDSFFSGFTPQLQALFNAANQTAFDAEINELVVNIPEDSVADPALSAARWGVTQGLWTFNTHSVYDWLKQSQNYTLARDDIPAKLKMPVWIASASNDSSFPGQAPIAYAAMKQANVSVTLQNFTGAAAYHCEAGAFDQSNSARFDWLDEVFDL